MNICKICYLLKLSISTNFIMNDMSGGFGVFLWVFLVVFLVFFLLGLSIFTSVLSKNESQGDFQKEMENLRPI